MTSWPPGYRSAPDKAASGWFKVEIGHIIVITGIATQGYGDIFVSEWLTIYMLLYSQGDDYSFFRETNGEIQVRSVLFSNNVTTSSGLNTVREAENSRALANLAS